MHSEVFEYTPSSQGVNTSITLDAAKWNCDGAELSSCVISTSIRSCIIIFGTLSEHIYQLTFILLFYVLIYMFMFLMYCDLHASFHSARIFIVCNMYQLIQNLIMVILF